MFTLKTLTFGVLLFTCTHAYAQTKDPFKDIYTVLVRQSDGNEQRPDKNAVKFSTKQVSIKENTDITKILSENGLYPDAESFNLVYTLNPQLRSLILKENTNLVIPSFDKGGNTKLSQALDEGFILVLTTNITLKKDLIQLSKSFNNNLATYSALTGESKDTAVINAADITSNLLEALRIMINGRTRPLNVEMLTQTKDEALYIDSILAKKQTRLNTADLEKVKSIGDNMWLRASLLEEVKGPGQLPEPYPEQDLVVKVISDSGKEVKGLRVYFAPPALMNNPQKISQLPQLSSPTSGRLPVANYRIWAGKPGDPSPVSDIFPLKLRKAANNEPIQLELVIK